MPNIVQETLKNMVVYIKVDGEIKGTGFFINEFGNVLTCYHIFSNVSSVQDLETINRHKIEIEFQNISYLAKAMHVTFNPRSLDILILKVENILSSLIHLSDFKTYEASKELVTCGYRKEELDEYHCNGLVHIEHSEDIAEEGFIILDDSSSHHKIIKGLSGSPLLEKESNAIVGMVVGRFNEKFEEYDEAIAIPLSRVASIFEPLRMKIEQYQHFLKLEQIFINDQFLATHRREALAEAFCERFLDDFCTMDAYSSFQTILRKVKEKNLISLFIEWIPYWIDQEFKRELSIKQFYFENREKDLEEVISEKEGSTFITIDGALSCGKTHMLLKLKERFEEESWLCYLIQCSKAPSTAEEIALSICNLMPINSRHSNEVSGYTLGNYMLRTKKKIEESFEKEIKGIVLLFDDIDRIEKEHEFEKFLRLIREINSILVSNDISSKTVIAGNNLSETIEEFDYVFDFVKKKKKIVLKPFKYPYVQKFIEKQMPKSIANIEIITARFF